MPRGYGDIPADLARRGKCADATRALDDMRPGLAQDYERERVGELCARSIAPADLSRSRNFYGSNSKEKKMGSLRWLDKALKKHSRSKGFKYKVVCPAVGSHGGKTTVTKSIHKKKSAATKVAKKLNRAGWWKGCRVVKY